MPDRHRDISRLTAGELERTQRDLRTSLALTTPGSRSRAAILAHLSAIDAELAERASGEKDQLPAPCLVAPGIACVADEFGSVVVGEGVRLGEVGGFGDAS